MAPTQQIFILPMVVRPRHGGLSANRLAGTGSIPFVLPFFLCLRQCPPDGGHVTPRVFVSLVRHGLQTRKIQRSDRPHAGRKKQVRLQGCGGRMPRKADIDHLSNHVTEVERQSVFIS